MQLGYEGHNAEMLTLLSVFRPRQRSYISTCCQQTDDESDGDIEDGDTDEEYDSETSERMRDLISKKLQREKVEKSTERSEEEREKKTSRRYDWYPT